MMEIVTSIVLLFLVISILVTIHVCIAGRAFGRRGDDGDNNGVVVQRGILVTRRSESMSQEEIKKLPCFDYKVEDEMREEKISNSSGFDCAVCLENFKVGEKCRLLPKCKHSFHAQCIDSWLVKTGACPICRTGAEVELQRFSSSHSSGVGGEG